MNTPEKNFLTVSTLVAAPIKPVWESWTDPRHIVGWNQASPEWHTPHASNKLEAGGKFVYRMESKDGSEGFDFEGVY